MKPHNDPFDKETRFLASKDALPARAQAVNAPKTWFPGKFTRLKMGHPFANEAGFWRKSTFAKKGPKAGHLPYGAEKFGFIKWLLSLFYNQKVILDPSITKSRPCCF